MKWVVCRALYSRGLNQLPLIEPNCCGSAVTNNQIGHWGVLARSIFSISKLELFNPTESGLYKRRIIRSNVKETLRYIRDWLKSDIKADVSCWGKRQSQPTIAPQFILIVVFFQSISTLIFRVSFVSVSIWFHNANQYGIDGSMRLRIMMTRLDDCLVKERLLFRLILYFYTRGFRLSIIGCQYRLLSERNFDQLFQLRITIQYFKSDILSQNS